MSQLVQVAGSLLILAAFVLSQLGRVRATSYSYLVLNEVGSAVLAVCALRDQQWGFLLLEGVWALVTAASQARRVNRSRSRAT